MATQYTHQDLVNAENECRTHPTPANAKRLQDIIQALNAQAKKSRPGFVWVPVSNDEMQDALRKACGKGNGH